MSCDPLNERYEDDPDVGILDRGFYLDWDGEDLFPACPVCSGTSIPLGTLGRREHYRCRDCGVQHSSLTGAPADNHQEVPL